VGTGRRSQNEDKRKEGKTDSINFEEPKEGLKMYANMGRARKLLMSTLWDGRGNGWTCQEEEK